MNVLKKTFIDFFTAKMIFYAVAPLILCGLLWFGLIGGVVYFLINHASDMINDGLEQINGINFLAHTWVVMILQWLLIGVVGLGGVFSSVYVGVALALFIISFLTPAIVSFVNARHYHHQNLTSVSFMKILWIMFCDSLKFIGFLLCSLIVFALPVIGGLFGSIGVFLSFFYIYYRFMLVDVRSCVLDKDKFFMPIKDEFPYKATILVFYLLSHIPFVGFFSQVAFIIYLAHFVYEKELGYGISK